MCTPLRREPALEPFPVGHEPWDWRQLRNGEGVGEGRELGKMQQVCIICQISLAFGSLRGRRSRSRIQRVSTRLQGGKGGGGAVQTAGREGRRVKVHLLRTGRFDFLRYEPPPTPAICDWTRTPHWPGLNEGFRCAARLCAARSDGNASGSRRGLRGSLSPSASLCFSLLLSASLCFLLLSPSPSCTVDMMGALSTYMRMYTYILTLSCTCNDRRAASNREAR